MKSTTPRCLALFLAVLVAALPAASAAAPSDGYREAYQRYEDGDYRGAISALEADWAGAPDDALLLGLARLRLDEPARAADAWAQFIRKSSDQRAASEVARLRTIVVREANRRAARAALAAGDPPKVSHEVLAVLPFRNVGAPEYEPLGKAIAAMLGESLGGVPTTRVVGRGRVEAFLTAADDGTGGDKVARRVGGMLGAGMVVVGAHVDASTDPMTLEVTSALIDTKTGRRLESGSFLSPLDRFYAAVRDTAVSLSAELGWPMSALPVASAGRVQAVYTESLDAALAFGRGLESEDRGDFDAARRDYEKALRADPSFSLARRQLVTLPAATMSMPAVAAAVQSELPVAEPPVVLAAAATPSPEPTSAQATPAPAMTVEPTATAAVVAVATGSDGTAAASATAVSPKAETGTAAVVGGEDEEEETTILGMSPMTAALVGGGVAAVVIGGAAAAIGGGGGGGGGGGNNPDPPVLSGVPTTRVVAAGEQIVLTVEGRDPEGSPVTLSASGLPGGATFDSTPGNPATGTFRWQTTEAGPPVEVVFTATASRGPPNNVSSEPATLTVTAAPPTPTPPPACGGTGASCSAASDCCQDIARACELTPAGGGTRCCLGPTAACQTDGNCCGPESACRGGRCCAPLGVACASGAACCDAGASCSAGSCCLPEGDACTNDSDCCSRSCSDGTCGGVAPPTPTPTPVPTPTPTPLCRDPGVACDTALQCCRGECEVTSVSSETLCCLALGQGCDDASNCCGRRTTCDGVCCLPVGTACTDAGDCCGQGAGCVGGRCCSVEGGRCTTSSDCCAGSCQGGACVPSSSAGAAAAPTSTPRPSPTPSPTPSPERSPL